MADIRNIRMVRDFNGKYEGCTIIIFGVTGDLTRRKLMPSLYNLFVKDLLPKDINIIGIARSFNDHEDFKAAMNDAIKEFSDEDESKINEFLSKLYFHKGDVKDAESYKYLKELLEKLENNDPDSTGNRLFYLAMPPETYNIIIENLHKNGLNKPMDKNSWTRIIIEKPFGHDLASAKELNKLVCRYFKEDQIYRIDHYLGKETVQNILAFRFANGIFEPIWNRNYIDHVQITSAETMGIGSRGSYYDRSGALRDMVQNHLLQLVAHTAMEPPATFEADKFRDEKVKVFSTIGIYKADEINKYVVRGQYGKGKIDGENVSSYKEEKDVSPDSCTETYAAMKLSIQNWRWAGVPFYVRTGKRLKDKVTEINLVFKETPHYMFKTLGKDFIHSNVLSLEIQPKEGIALTFAAKYPGQGMKIKPVKMDFCYNDTFNVKSADSYERLLMDCIAGDQTLYARRDAVEMLWGIVDPILKSWEECKQNTIPFYEAGSWGPKEADELLSKDGRCWMIMK